MKRLRFWLYGSPYARRHPNAALRGLERNLQAAESSPLSAFLSFSPEAEAMGLGPDWEGLVADVEAEGSRLIGAVPCPGDHGATYLTRLIDTGLPAVVLRPCPSCGAAV